MIFWIASYPKSGNTWLRTLISSYYYSDDGIYMENNIKKIGQFPEKKYFSTFNYNQNIVTDTSRFWIKAQEKINSDKQLRFFKTHNVFGKINENPFTNKKNSLGCIYIIRDPRNVITSLSNHYELNLEDSLNWMTNHKKYIFDNREEKILVTFNLLAHGQIIISPGRYKKDLPVKIVRYEDLLEKTFSITKEIIEFINKSANLKQKININKLKNSVKSTSFDVLKKYETQNGFSEAIFSNKKNKMIPFFNLGPKNNWKNILKKDFADKLTVIFKDDLKEFNYFV